ncbi:MAG TPA: sensor histidine kinase [Ktedonobacterales bacterium]
MQMTPERATSERAFPRNKRNMARRVERIFANPFSPMEFAAYVTIAGGYLLAVLTAQGSLTLLGFAALTVGNLTWLWVFQRMHASDCTGPKLTRLVASLIAVTILIEALPPLGVGFDWLLPLVTVGIIGSNYPWRRALALTGMVYLLSAVVIVAIDDMKAQDIFNNLVTLTPAFIFVFAFSVVARWQLEQREHAEALVSQLEEAQAQLRAYAHEVEELGATRERNRIAREIHDTLGHYLTILAVQLETATKLEERDDPRLHSELVEARRVASECLNEVRHSVAALRPTDPTATSVSDALATLAAEFEAVAPDTAVALDVEGAVQALPPEVRVALYRSVQESLTNIRKHAQATKVLVRLRVDVRNAELLVLDNGTGAASCDDGHEPGFGIVGMRERIALLGGTAKCGPDTGRGWRVDVRVPLPDETGGAEIQTEVALAAGADVKEQVA